MFGARVCRAGSSEKRHDPLVFAVLSAPNTASAALLAAQIAMSVRYHTQIGVAAVLLYVRANVLDSLVHDPAVGELIRQHVLFVIRCAPCGLCLCFCVHLQAVTQQQSRIVLSGVASQA
jgi:hypothetical protein